MTPARTSGLEAHKPRQLPLPLLQDNTDDDLQSLVTDQDPVGRRRQG